MIAPELVKHAPTLARVAALCALAEQKAREGAICIPHRLEDAETMALAAGKDSAAALALLRGLGVTPPREAQPRPVPKNPLAELRKLDASRSEALTLLEALRATLPAAEALDAARGNALDAPVLGSRGLVWGEDLVQMIARLELELFGPSAAVTGSRE